MSCTGKNTIRFRMHCVLSFWKENCMLCLRRTRNLIRKEIRRSKRSGWSFGIEEMSQIFPIRRRRIPKLLILYISGSLADITMFLHLISHKSGIQCSWFVRGSWKNKMICIRQGKMHPLESKIKVNPNKPRSTFCILMLKHENTPENRHQVY